mgnify:CR=1 FL=1
MQYMMINKFNVLYLFCITLTTPIIAQQTNNLSSSPYSLYGLGITNNTSTGKTNALGKMGIALPSLSFINNSNPASFASIPSNRFLFDFGLKAQSEILRKSRNEESRFNTNFSSLAIAFPISKNSGFGVTLLPYTNVGYTISGILSSIEGSTSNFITDINGSGGINDFKLSYGYRINDNFRLGINGSFLFGLIEEQETNTIGGSILTIDEKNNYTGFRLGFGIQYDVSYNISLGAIINTATNLNGEQENITALDGNELNLSENNLPTFQLPLEIGFGVLTKLTNKIGLNFDYKKNFWNTTNQSDNIGNFVDQDFLGIGLEYTPKKRGLKYWENIQYRTGFNFDSGSLEIDNNKISNYEFNLGLGLPLKRGSNSMLNIEYSYGKKGTVSNGLIQENYHSLSLNLSLEGIWFKKRKID